MNAQAALPVAAGARGWASRAEREAWRWSPAFATLPEEERLVRLLMRWRADPVCFAVEACSVVLLPYQVAILLDLFDAPAEVFAFYGVDPDKPKRQVLAPAGHGVGKTRIIAVAIWCQLLTCRFSLTLVTAPTSDQLTGRVSGEVRKMRRRIARRWPALAADWEVLGTSITHRDPNFGDWCCNFRTARPEKPEGLQGAHALDADDEFGDLARLFGDSETEGHAGGILVIAEEASGIDDSLREVLEGALSEEGARLFAPGNPTRADGWFARDVQRTDRYAVHCIDCRNSSREDVYLLPYRDFGGTVHHLRQRGFVRPSYWHEILRECDGDEDADRVRVRVRGIPPRSNFESVIRAHWVDAAVARQPDADSLRQRAVIGLDFGLTSDKHGGAVRRGFACLLADEWLPADLPEAITLQAAQWAIEQAETFGAGAIVGDANGVGRGAMEYLACYYRERPQLRVQVVLFNSGAGALDDRRYYRRRDEMWARHGRKWVSDGRCSLPPDPVLRTQLCAPGMHEDATRRIKVEGKDAIKKRTGQPSGNRADALLHTLMVAEPEAIPAPAPAPVPVFSPVFAAHFARLRNRADSGRYIR